MQNFFLGQTAMLMMGFLACFYQGFCQRNDLPAAMAIALAALLKPHQAAFMVIIALAGKRWRLVATAMGLVAVLFAFRRWCWAGSRCWDTRRPSASWS